jgi:hypothetical protein
MAKEEIILILASIMVLAVISFISYFSMSVAHGLRQEGLSAEVTYHANLLYNNQSYDMSPFVSVSNGQLSKFQLPLDGEDVAHALPINIKQGDTIGFKFSKKPLKVSVFAIDYEAQPSELYALKKVGFNTFQLLGPQGIQNLEAQVLFDSRHYVSYDILVYVIPSIREQQSGQFDISQGASSSDIQGSNASNTSSVCRSQAKLDIMGITASTQNLTNNVPVNVLDNNLGTAWSTRGADVISFAKSLAKGAANKNPWLQLDLGTQRQVCMFGIAFASSDTDVDFFTVQTSDDGKYFKDVGSAQSTPISSRGLLYWFPDLPISTRFVRISNLGSITSGHAAINEIALLGR